MHMDVLNRTKHEGSFGEEQVCYRPIVLWTFWKGISVYYLPRFLTFFRSHSNNTHFHCVCVYTYMSITHIINWVPDNAGKQCNSLNKKNVDIVIIYSKFEIYKYIQICLYIFIYIYEHTYVHVCILMSFLWLIKNRYKAVGLKLWENCLK